MSIFDLDSNGFILKQHIDNVIRFYFGADDKRQRGGKWNVRCNVCNDSKKNKSKRRGWILQKNGHYQYYCHNGDCNSNMPATVWMKEYFKSEYNDYIRDLLVHKNQENQGSIVEPKEEVIELPTLKRTKYVDINEYSFKPIMSEKTGIFHQAQQFCIKRGIPEEVYTKFFVCLEWDKEKPGYKYRNRLIIPFFDDRGNIFYFQGRTLDNNDAKYINYDSSKDEGIILYNKFQVDYEEPILVLEGPVDSMFAKNAVAALSTNIGEDTQAYLDRFDCHYIFDSDIPGKKKALEYLKQGRSVFLWKKFCYDFKLPKREKIDLNDVYLYLKRNSKLSYSELKNYFSKSYYSSPFI